MAPATRRPQPQHGQESPGNSCSQVDREKRVPLDKEQEGPRQDKGGRPSSRKSQGGGLSQPRDTRLLAQDNSIYGVYTRHPDDGRKGEMPFLEQQGGEILEKAVFRKKEEKL